jgi:phosphate uptake regulator
MGFFRMLSGGQPPLVRQAFADVKVMLSNGHEMFAAATAFLLDNEILDTDLSGLDVEINRREQDLRRAVLQHLTVDPGTELLFCLKMISIVHEAERIGDLAKSLAKVGHLARMPRMGPLVLPLRDMRDRILAMFELTQKGFVEGEVEAARELMRRHGVIKDDTTRYLKDLAEREDITPNEAVTYALSVRLLSRVSSHLANIASTVASPFDQIRQSPTWSEEQRS